MTGIVKRGSDEKGPLLEKKCWGMPNCEVLQTLNHTVCVLGMDFIYKWILSKCVSY